MFIHEAGSEVVVVDGGGECDGVGDILLVAAVDVFVLVGLEVLLIAAIVVAGRNLGGGDVSDGHMTPIQTPEIGVALSHVVTAPAHTLKLTMILLSIMISYLRIIIMIIQFLFKIKRRQIDKLRFDLVH